MRLFIDLQPCQRDRLWDHLLPHDAEHEAAAFLFVHHTKSGPEASFSPVEIYLADPTDFAQQYADFIELTDDARVRLIKTAHELCASIIEVHSHLGPWPAAFSTSDRRGLMETVPHMWWRLGNKPYGAIVVAQSGLDCLIWWNNPRIPRHIDGIRVGCDILTPTNLSLEGWR